MRFELTPEQGDFARSLESLLAGADPVAVARSWAEGEPAPGLKLWQRLAEQGVCALLVPEDNDGMGASAVELAVAFEALGRHAVPGPWVESAAFLPVVLQDADALGALAAGEVGSVAVPPHVPFALDAHLADHVFLVSDGRSLVPAQAGEVRRSVDATRHLVSVTATTDGFEPSEELLRRAFDLAVLATSAQLLGAGERLLADTVAYVKQRRQFGREIGSYQAVKHQLADVRIALDFARPLVFGAALSDGTDDFSRDVSAAKVACGDAAYLASRTGLQLHGAIGYTAEFDLSLWVTKVRALVTAWGTPGWHRSRILQALVEAGA